jgi:diaminopimelate decarboxylase
MRPHMMSSARFAKPATSLARPGPLCVAAGDLLAVMSAGAYGMAMSRTTTPATRALRLWSMATGHEIRRRETVAELFAGESLLPA